MNWYVQFLRDSEEKHELVDSLQGLACFVALCVFFAWVLWA